MDEEKRRDGTWEMERMLMQEEKKQKKKPKENGPFTFHRGGRGGREHEML